MGAKKGSTKLDWNGRCIKLICKVCGKPFNVYPSHSHFKYCSKSCFYHDPDRPKRRKNRVKKNTQSVTQRREEILDEILYSDITETRHNQLLDEYYKL